MKALYVIVVYFLNATTGEPENEYHSATPLTLEQCAQALIDRGPVPVKDNKAQFAVCQKIKADARL